MTNSKKTKRTLLYSGIALILCFTMLLGTTFAWFTDTASTAVNKIQAGTLDVELLDKEGNSLEGKTLSWQKAAGHENEAVLWEPGASYDLETVTIKNNGNLALKFKVVITGINGDAKLNEVIDWTVKVGDDTFDADTEFHLSALSDIDLTISGTMQTTAGNEYQGLSIDSIAISVVATQDTVEFDSTTNQYDAQAEYPDAAIIITKSTEADDDWYDEEATTLEIKDADDFLAFMETAYTWGVSNKPNVPNFKNQTVVLNADVYLPDGYLWTPISPYDSQYNGNGGFQGTFDGQGHTIYNLNVTNNNKTGRGYRIGLFGEVGDGAVFKNLTLDGVNTYAGNSSAGAVCAQVNGSVTFENITVRNSTIRQGRYAGGIVGNVANGTTTFKNCTVEDSAIFNIHNNYCGALYGARYSSATVVVDNCTITNVVKHFFAGNDWDTFHYISLADALVAYADEPATEGGN